MRPEDFRSFYGRDIPFSARGWVAELDGRVIGLAGFALLGNPPMAFSDMTEEMKAFPVTIMRESRKVMKTLAKDRKTAYCLASKDLPGSEKFLQRLGWKWHTTDPNGEIYAWQTRSPG